MNASHAHLTEFGIFIATYTHNVERLLEVAGQAPVAVRPTLELLANQLRARRPAPG